eukprot:scaffold12118_cov138-Cylindrotheca_fusiformis.AAC.2
MPRISFRLRRLIHGGLFLVHALLVAIVAGKLELASLVNTLGHGKDTPPSTFASFLTSCRA